MRSYIYTSVGSNELEVMALPVTRYFFVGNVLIRTRHFSEIVSGNLLTLLISNNG